MLIESNSPAQTRDIGRYIAKYLRAGDCVPLFGDMGAGKTHLIQGIAAGLNVPDSICVNSPSFTIVNRYEGVVPIYHIDLYRLDADVDFSDLELEELLNDSGITLIEWPEMVMDLLREIPLKITMIWPMEFEMRRELTLSSDLVRFEPLFQELKNADLRN